MKAYVTGRKRVQITELDIALSIKYTLKTKPKPKPITCIFHTFPALCFAPVLSAGFGLETGLPIRDWSFPKLETNNKPLACEA